MTIEIGAPQLLQMENGSAYGGNPLPASAHLHPHHHGHHPASTAAALVAFSQANSQALGEALRLSSQRPFPQVTATIKLGPVEDGLVLFSVVCVEGFNM